MTLMPHLRHADAASGARWAAFVARDASFAGQFYMAVKTTGIYCRPGCPARLPKPSNVTFYDTREEAEAAGFRPCKRCKPDDIDAARAHRDAIAAACRMIETAEEAPNLDELARAAGMSPSHFHRLFKRIAGVTPKAYAVAHRNQRVREELRDSGSVTEAIYAAGFGSNGRFYANSSEVLGMTPTAYRTGASGQKIRFAISRCSLGDLLVAESERGICAILFGDERSALIAGLRRQFPAAAIEEADTELKAVVGRVVAYVEEPGEDLGLPLDIRGTAFQHRVWEALRRIPAGSTASYTDIAREIGAPQAVRAVAGACAANPIAVAIPCHRVVRSDGALSGYRGGVERKRALLAKEARKKPLLQGD